MPTFEFVPKRLIRVGWVVGLATSLATICLYENTGNLRQGRADNLVPSEGCITRDVALDEAYGVTRIEARVDCAKDDEQKSWRKIPIAAINPQS